MLLRVCLPLCFFPSPVDNIYDESEVMTGKSTAKGHHVILHTVAPSGKRWSHLVDTICFV